MVKSIEFILLLLCLREAAASYDNKLLRTIETVLDDGTLSESCKGALALYEENLRAGTQWALRMLDATSKIPEGILLGNLGELGQFEECLKTESEDELIKARYCLGSITITSASLTQLNNHFNSTKASETVQRALRIQELSRRIRLQPFDEDNSSSSVLGQGMPWALCLPHHCTNEDFTEIFFNLFGSRSAVCQTKENLSPPLTNGAIATIVVLAYFAFLLIVSTGFDIYYTFYKKSGTPHVLLTAFSIYSNGKKLFRVSKNSSELTCLNGMRLYSMMWVIIGHVYSTSLSDPVVNFNDVFEWLDALRSMIIVSGTLSVDTFFMMAGLPIVYGYFKSKYQGKNFNIFHFYIHRYLRLTPPLAAAILVNAHLVKYMGTGPNWGTIVTTFEEPCKKHWWVNLLHLQNYITLDDGGICLGQTWYLSIDMHMYILSPLLLIPLWKYPKIGLSIIFAGIITFIIVPFYIAYNYELIALMSNIQQFTNNNFMRLYYIKTHARAAPWFIGALTGYMLAKIKFQGGLKFKIRKLVVIIAWMGCIAIGITCIYGGHSTLRGLNYDLWGNSFYIALVKPAWSVCLAWVIFACVTGYGGPINWFLSWPIYQVLNRFTYSMYLIHYTLIFVISLSTKTGIYFDELSVALAFWGVTMLTFGISVLWVLAFESPIVIFEKILFGGVKMHSKTTAGE